MDGSVKEGNGTGIQGKTGWRRSRHAVALVALAAAVAGCGQNIEPGAAVGKEKRLHSIVSLAPSNTELLLDAGAENAIAGVCSNCRQVLPDGEERLKHTPIAGTFTSVNLERLTRLQPEAVLVVSGQEAIAALLKKRGFAVVLLNNDKLKNIPANLRQIGELSGARKSAQEHAAQFEQAIQELSDTLGGAPARPKVFYCIWPQPLLTIGARSFLNDVITTCGGTNIAANLPQSYPHYSAEHLILADPDVIVLPYEAKSLDLFKRFPWNKLRAVNENRLFYLPSPKDDRLARPTMGVLDGLYWLAGRIHPELKDKLDVWHSRFCSTQAKN